MELNAVGVPSEHLRLYRYFLRHPGRGAESACEDFGMDRDAVDEVLESLQAKSLLRLSDRHTVLVSDPAVAVEWLIDQRLGELQAESDEVRAARKAIASLAEDHRHGMEEAPAGDIERIDGVDAIRTRLADLAFFTFRELMALVPDRWQPESIELARPSDLRMLRRGIRWRTVVGPAALADPLTLAYLRELVALGGQVRCTEQAIRRMVIWDRGVSMVPVDPDNHLQATLVVRQAGLVANTVAWFEQVWESAEELPAEDSPAGTGPQLSETERLVLGVLTRTEKDEAAAREMGVSIRTFRRYVADIMLRLGAANRFQAGLLAKEKGWI
ncbi:LuxR C-terminal-related transcriptional regulator [Kitasatospora sp. NPDC050543]|uniref:helix-turn-helix transcriptional regulator n=1 Tax=Kitasatospora sp. NPDC050543 TaxID=3364054 RepID=UPI00378EBB08